MQSTRLSGFLEGLNARGWAVQEGTRAQTGTYLARSGQPSTPNHPFMQVRGQGRHMPLTCTFGRPTDHFPRADPRFSPRQCTEAFFNEA